MRWRVMSLGAFLLGLCLLPAGIGAAMGQSSEARTSLKAGLSRASSDQSQLLNEYFARSRSIDLLVSRNPAIQHFYELPGSREAKLRAGGPVVEDVNHALRDVDDLFRDSISETCLIDRSGAEVARMVRTERATVDHLSLDEKHNPFFAPAFAVKQGHVFQSRPYISPDTGEWVIGNATPIPTTTGVSQAIIHFEVSMDSFRRAMTRSSLFNLGVVDGTNGAVIIDSRRPQLTGAPLGQPRDKRFEQLAIHSDRGTAMIGGRLVAFSHVTQAAGNANDWYVFAVSRSAEGVLFGVHAWTMWLVAAALMFLLVGALTGQLSHRRLSIAASTDLLTTLGNRRALLRDMSGMIRGASPAHPLLLILFDLNGFKAYNDRFGHPAGDALLNRLGKALRTAMEAQPGPARAYRLGGDEFCVLAPLGPDGAAPVTTAACEALTEHGAGFRVDASHGTVFLPDETSDAEEALRIVDQRMYANKRSGRRSADQQSKDVLIRALDECRPELRAHTEALTRLVGAVTQHLHMDPTDRHLTLQAAELQDIGIVAIPDPILCNRGAMTEDDQAFLRRATSISERIIAAAPALAPVAQLVHSANEWFDGSGDPDHMQSGQIPLGSRVLAACSTYVSLTQPWPPTEALSSEEALTELHRHAGTRFDPHVVRTVTAVVHDLQLAPAATP